jgi:hypothetical protein
MGFITDSFCGQQSFFEGNTKGSPLGRSTGIPEESDGTSRKTDKSSQHVDKSKSTLMKI